jgi:hypothetical protein
MRTPEEKLLAKRQENKKWRDANPEEAKATARRWREANLEKIKKYRMANRHKDREYRDANREKCKLACRKYRVFNPEKAKASEKKWREANREKVNERSKRWAKRNPEKIAARVNIRRAIKIGASIGDPKTIAKWEKSWRFKKSAICYWCSERVSTKTCHMDHINPLSRGGSHSIENLCISCQPCNNKKYVSDLKTWNAKIKQPVLF